MSDVFSKEQVSFEEFWEMSPRSGSKHQARKKFASFSHELQRQAAENVDAYYRWWCKSNAGASTLHVTTYLNQRRWEDDDWRFASDSRAPTQQELMAAAVSNIKSGKPYLCTGVSFSQARYLAENGYVTEDECRKVGKW